MKDILIVEDQEGERLRLHKLFDSSGYSVEVAESVTKAEELLVGTKFRLTFLDIGLGDKSGSNLFHQLKKTGSIPYVIIYTGNPSVHLKQRFMADGAADYIVKGSTQAGSDKLLARVKEIIGETAAVAADGIPLNDFLNSYIDASFKKLFLNMDGSIPKCAGCGSANYVVSFKGFHQIPPDITGKVRCAGCAKEMDPEIS